MKTDISKLIKNKRINEGISQSKLSQISGVSRRTIAEIENGLTKTPHLETLIKLFDVLNIEIEGEEEYIADKFFEAKEIYQFKYKIVIAGTCFSYGDNDEEIRNNVILQLQDLADKILNFDLSRNPQLSINPKCVIKYNFVDKFKKDED